MIDQWFKQFGLAFIPLFFAMNVMGAVPIFLAMTSNLSKKSKSKLARDASITAFSVSFLFVFTGASLFRILGITENDFRIGGGIVLLIIAIMDLLFSDKDDSQTPLDAGIVPLGVPLIIGPAAMTTMMMLVNRYGYSITLSALFVNLLIVWVVFSQAQWVVRLIGNAGTKVFTKVFSLFLAAIAIMMIRVGVINSLETLGILK